VVAYQAVSASNSTKFDAYAGATGQASPPAIITADPVHIPLTGTTYTDQTGFLGDVRAERQFFPCNEGHPNCEDMLTDQVLPFAAAHPGHLYVLGDEYPGHCSFYAATQTPCSLYITADMYADWFYRFTSAVSIVDPDARFAPAGIFVQDTATAEFFYNYYLAAYDVPPPVSEWRFHLGEISDASNAAAWSVAHGAPMAWVIGPFDPGDALAGANLDSLLAFANSDSRIVQVTYYGYDIDSGSPHRLVDTNGNLTSKGIVYKNHALGSPSLPGESIAQLGDFNGDNCDDIADHDTATGFFNVRHSNCAGVFGPPGWAAGTAQVGADYDVLVGDFTGDGLADYADVRLSTGEVYVHPNNGIGGFGAVVWGYADMRDGPDWELMAADINGDGLTDIVERQISTGLLFASLNIGGTPFVDTANRKYLGRSKNGPDWRVIFANLNGDTKADFADQYLPSGEFLVHFNTGSPGYRMDNVARGGGQASTGGSFRTVIGDFNGDGFADYMDLWTATGAYWLHNNLANPLVVSFVPPGSNSGTGTMWVYPTGRIFGSR
jgi:hypothetical protein